MSLPSTAHRPISEQLFARGKELLPGGVNSPVRAFRGVGGTPVFFRSAKGAWLTDADGHRYVDLVGSWGPMLFGHAYGPVTDALREAALSGTSFGAPHEGELLIAELVRRLVPSMQMMRMVSSGTEATAAAIRLARGFTSRDRILKFDGCYHGASDSLLVKAGSGVETLGLPDSPGVPAALAKLTSTLPWNDVPAAEAFFAAHGGQIACVILEPTIGNMGCIPAAKGFLEALRALTEKHGALLIFDEVMTGFRVARGGAQERFGIRPDLSTFGKVIGGGLPVGAYGGRADVMAHIAPSGSVYQAGTLSGNPLAVAAGRAMLEALADGTVYATLEAISAKLSEALVAPLREAGVPFRLNRMGSMFTVFFTATDVTDAETARTADKARFGKWFHALLDRGVYLPPSQFEAAFVSAAHGEAELAHVAEAAREAAKGL